MNRPSVKFSLLALLVTGFVAGILFCAGFSVANEKSLTLEFCISCHEMRDTSFEEYKTTVHYSNRTGVRATCSDCHEPKDFTHMMIRKAQAATEVWGSLAGTIDTKEKFEANRMKMATWEWARMQASGSRECKSCHNFDAMSPTIQKQSVYKQHMAGKAAGKTCIDCHKGIAHHLPKEYRDPDEDE